MSLQTQRNVTLRIDWPGLGALGTWDKKTGSSADSDETKYSPGAMGAEKALGGRKTAANITLSRLFDPPRDRPLMPALMAARGVAHVTVSDQYLDENGNAFGAPIVYTGRLKAVNDPDADSESNTAALLALEISTDAEVAA